MLELNINDFRKKAKIRFSAYPEGFVFGVHRLSAGAELQLSALSRKAAAMVEELKNEKITDERLQEIDKELDDLKDKQLQLKASVFDDGGDGSISLQLVMELSEPEIMQIVEAVENGVNIRTEDQAADAAEDKPADQPTDKEQES